MPDSIDKLKISDIDQLISLTINAKCEHRLISNLKKFKEILLNTANQKNRPLKADELQQLCSDKITQLYMILFFLAKNTALEHLRLKHKPFKDEVVLISQVWHEIKETLTNKLLLSREINSYFKERGGRNGEEFKTFVALSKTIQIDDLMSEKFATNDREGPTCSLFINEKYMLKDNAIAPSNIGITKTPLSCKEEYALSDRKLCYHAYLYDPFRFGGGGEPEFGTAYRYINECKTRKNIESIFTVKYSEPELTVLLKNGSFTKIAAGNITDYLEQKKHEGEIDEKLYNEIKSDYPHLFYPILNIDIAEHIYHQIKELINKGVAKTKLNGKPLLIVLAEIHNSKNSFLLQIMVLLIAKEIGIRHVLLETINLYHKKYGWDAPVEATNRLIQFSLTDLAIHVKDLESKLHYNNIETPYPYHDLPEGMISEEIREASWIIDANALNDNAILILGAGHLNGILNSKLKDTFVVLPINCTCDKRYSDALSITNSNFIDLENNLTPLTLDEIINIAQKIHKKIEGTD